VDKDRGPAHVHQLLAGLDPLRRALLPGHPAQHLHLQEPQQMFGAVAKTYYAEKTGVKPEDIVWSR